jgi:O-acetyl-ADP-ribose deacetylase (regulator of RNase III)
MGEGDEDDKLAAATRSALALAEQHGLRSIAFPAISTGIFGYPMDRCAEVMLGTIIAFLAAGSTLERVAMCLWGEEALRSFADELARHAPGEESA